MSEAQKTFYKWTPIADLPTDYARLASPDLKTLSTIWLEQRIDLEKQDALFGFIERLKRQWAIETGIIERVYTLSRGTTELLIHKGISESLIPSYEAENNPKLVAAIIQDHANVVEGLFDFVNGRRSLTTSYIKELHAQLLKHQDRVEGLNHLGQKTSIQLIKGDYKKFPNNPTRPDGKIHEYCPPECVAAEMDRLIAMHQEHEKNNVPPEIQAAWLHHRFTQIHPFQDGNGRVARALATLLVIKAKWFPLTITQDDRDKYISALEAADNGNIKDLIDFFTSLLKKSFIHAFDLATDAMENQKVEQVIQATKKLLLQRRDEFRQEWEGVKTTSKHLEQEAEKQFEEIKRRIKREVSPLLPAGHDIYVDTAEDDSKRSFYHRRQIVETAKKFDYYANTSVYRAWVRLVLKTQDQAEVLISFHGMGFEFRGILVASMCFFRRDIAGGEKEIHDLVAVSDSQFQFSYKENSDEVLKRFSGWIDKNMTTALEMWRKGL